MLKSRILDSMHSDKNARLAADRKQRWGAATGVNGSEPTISQGRMTDHRIGLTLYRLDAIMEGDMEKSRIR